MDPYNALHLEHAAYKKSESEMEKYLETKFTSKGIKVERVDSKTIGGKKVHLFRVNGEKLDVAVQGTNNIINVGIYLFNQLNKDPIGNKKLENQIRVWEKKYGKIEAAVAHSAGAALLTSALEKRDDISIYTFNGQKSKKGVNLRTSDDPISSAFLSNPEKYQTVGKGGHRLGAFNSICREGVTWADLEDTAIPPKDHFFGKTSRYIQECIGHEIKPFAKKLLKKGVIKGLDKVGLKDIFDLLPSEAQEKLFDKVTERIFQNTDAEIEDIENFLEAADDLKEKLKDPENAKTMDQAITEMAMGWRANALFKEELKQIERERTSREEIRKLDKSLEEFYFRLNIGTTYCNHLAMNGSSHLIAQMNASGMDFAILNARKYAQEMKDERDNLREKLNSHLEKKDKYKSYVDRVKHLENKTERHFKKKNEKRIKYATYLSEMTMLVELAATEIPGAGPIVALAGEAAKQKVSTRIQEKQTEEELAKKSIGQALTSWKCLQNQNEQNITMTLSQTRQLGRYLMQARNMMKPKDFREEIKKQIDDCKKEEGIWKGIEDKSSEKKSSHLGMAKHLEAKKHRNSRQRAKNEGDALSYRAYAEEEENIETYARENRESVEKERVELEKTLENERYVAGMRDNAFKTIEKTLQSYWGVDEKDQLRNKTLMDHHNSYQEARDLHRRAYLGLLTNAHDLTKQLEMLTGEHRISVAAGAAIEIYNLTEIGRYWGEFAIPQLQKIAEEGGAEDVFKTLLSPIGISLYVVPFVGTIVAGISTCHSLYKLCSDEKPLTEEQRIIKALEQGLNALKDCMNIQFRQIHQKLEEGHSEVLLKFQQQQNQLSLWGNFLLSEMKSGQDEVLKKIDDSDYKTLVLNLDNTMSKMHVTSKVIDQLLEQLTDPVYNGYEVQRSTSRVYENVIKLRVDHRLMIRRPGLFSGYIARNLELGKTPNINMYLKVVDQLLHDEDAPPEILLSAVNESESQGLQLLELEEKVEHSIVNTFHNRNSLIDLYEKKIIEVQNLKQNTLDSQLKVNWGVSHKNKKQNINGGTRFQINRVVHNRKILSSKPYLEVVDTMEFWKNLGRFSILFILPGIAYSSVKLDNYVKRRSLISRHDYYNHLSNCIEKHLSSALNVVNSEAFNFSSKEEENRFLETARTVELVKINAKISYNPEEDIFLKDMTGTSLFSIKSFSTEHEKKVKNIWNQAQFLNIEVDYHIEGRFSTEVKVEGIFTIDDLRLIQPPPKGLDYDVKVKYLLQSYLNPESNPHLFKNIYKQSDFILAKNRRDVPLAFPKTLMQELRSRMRAYVDETELMALNHGFFLPCYSFEKEASEGNYLLRIHFEYNGKTFISYPIASFDQAAFESFGRLDMWKKGDKYTYKWSPPHRDEFLIQMMYSGSCGLGMPGKGTHSIHHNGETFYAPFEHPFCGLWNVLKDMPQGTFHFNTRIFDGSKESVNRMLQTPEKPNHGEAFDDVIKMLRSSRCSLDEKMKDYENSYYELMTHCMIFSAVPANDLQMLLYKYLGIFPPKLPHFFNALAAPKRHEQNTERFKEIVFSLPSKEKLKLCKALHRLTKKKRTLEDHLFPLDRKGKARV